MISREDTQTCYIAGVLGSILTISFLSGFHLVEVPFELRWQFSPIGLLQPLRQAYWNLKSQASFEWAFSWNWDYADVFLKTCVLEAPFYYFALRPIKLDRILATILLANFITHPVVFFIFPALFENYYHSLVGSELYANLAEIALVTFWFRASSNRNTFYYRAALISLANIFSWQVGSFL